jgi:hypothetical protein
METRFRQHLARPLLALALCASATPHDNELAMDVREPGLQGIHERFPFYP